MDLSTLTSLLGNTTVLYILAGALVGFAVGVTGVGGGSLMTPLLLMFGFPAPTAIGTDLLYAAITKSNGVWIYHRQESINWRVMSVMAAGSLTTSLSTIYILDRIFNDANEYNDILTSTLGVMLIATAIVIIFKERIQNQASLVRVHPENRGFHTHPYTWTFVTGLFLGILVTLSSVGAGAFGTAVLMILYPRWQSTRIVGTDLAHAVPLTLVAGIGHIFLGHVDWMLLLSLLTGSLPAIYVGAKVATRLPDRLLQIFLAMALGGMGLKYTFF